MSIVEQILGLIHKPVNQRSDMGQNLHRKDVSCVKVLIRLETEAHASRLKSQRLAVAKVE